MNRKHPILALYFVIVIFFVSCTSNPFGSDNNISNNTVIGNVELNDGLSPKNVFAWFKVFDISTRTDEEGHFELTLPPSGSQAAGGLNGIYSLYFYMANYQLDSVQIVITNGNIQASSTGVKNNGELVEKVQLAKILSIKATSNSDSFIDTNVDTIRFTFTVQAMEDVVDVSGEFSSPLFKGDPEFMVGFVRKIDSQEDFCFGVFRENRTNRTINFRIELTATELLPLEITNKPGTYTPGQYEVIPSLVIHQDLPAGLLERLNRNITGSCEKFYNVPLTVENNRFQVLKLDNMVNNN